MVHGLLAVRIGILVTAVIMVISGAGILWSLINGWSTLDGGSNYGLRMGLHGLTIAVPGLFGIFIPCKRGCSSKRGAFTALATLSILGFLTLAAFVLLLRSDLTTMLSFNDKVCAKYASDVPASTTNTNLYSIRTKEDCERVYFFGVLLATMWAVGGTFAVAFFLMTVYLTRVLGNKVPVIIITPPSEDGIEVTPTEQRRLMPWQRHHHHKKPVQLVEKLNQPQNGLRANKKHLCWPQWHRRQRKEQQSVSLTNSEQRCSSPSKNGQEGFPETRSQHELYLPPNDEQDGF